MIITRTPLRVSFAGGGTDIPAWYENHGPGKVLSAAIGLYVTVVVSRHYEHGRYRLAYSLVQTTDNIEHIEHDLLRCALKRRGETEGGVEIHTIADVPGHGSGLGSSAAVLVGTIKALAEWRGHGMSEKDIAEEAAAIEIMDLRNGAGKQDHYTSSCGGVLAMVFADREPTVKAEQVSYGSGVLEKWSRWMPIVPTGTSRLAGPSLQKTNERILSGQAVDAMRASLDLLPRIDTALWDGKMAEVGRLLDEAWTLKREATPHVTSTLLDIQYARALSAGALGGKLCGAGGGGHWLFVVPPGRWRDVEAALYQPAIPVQYGVAGSRTVFQEAD